MCQEDEALPTCTAGTEYTERTSAQSDIPGDAHYNKYTLNLIYVPNLHV